MGRIGIFGGSFNPIHVAHLILAERVREERSLDRVLFVPAAQPPHKPPAPLASAEDRARMVELALQGNPAFALERLEVEREGESYTLLTVRELRRRTGPEGELFLLLGADSVLDLPNWWHAEELVAEVPVIAFGRPGHPLEGRWGELAAEFGQEWVQRVQDLMVSAPLLDISATAIRRRVQEGLSVRYLVPEGVRRYVMDRGLYRRE